MFDLHDHWDPPDTPGSRSLLEGICEAGRAENQSAARRLRSIGELFEMRRAQRGGEEHWAVDTWAAVGAEIAAALRISLGKAGSYLAYGLAMRRLPAVALVFADGDIDMAAFQTIVYRTDLISDPDAMGAVDRRIAAWARRLPSMSRGRLARELDAIVHVHDPDAVRRAHSQSRDREISIWNHRDGIADISGRLLSTDALLLDKRLDELAATVCPADPRTKEHRRTDAHGALAVGADRLLCRCGQTQCPAVAPTRSGVIIHIVAEQSTVDGTSPRPAYLMGADTLITPELLRELAAGATTRPMTAPSDRAL